MIQRPLSSQYRLDRLLGDGLLEFPLNLLPLLIRSRFAVEVKECTEIELWRL